ncbi:hypothetical protein Aple_055250 [Acrocarpospora pleiomorpha]|uniref:OmpA-like domain-containing protein n=1 Tax=Acrocarpospora pleiomorpha TaxID=90975 RepID=A0A5M3XMM8_9ACTN|nr:OmpA family protein [Acrocarpospora pleiomorpha]GES22627.1 hypothetical protein Aple_055250 [Acrocarpospora pleiomorpha]
MRSHRKAAVVVLLSISLAGCEGPKTREACDWMKTTSPVAGGSFYLIDVSGSTTAAQPGAAAPLYPAALKPLAEQDIAARANVSIGSFSGTETGWRAADGVLSTDWLTGNDNEENQESRRKTALGCLTERFADTAKTPPGSPQSDPLKALSVAGAGLAGLTGPKRLAMATDGLVTIGCADLTWAGFGTESEIDEIVKLCLDRHEITPGLLSGVQVTLVGVGSPGSGRPFPTAAQQDWLKRLWTKLCLAFEPEKCSVDTPVNSGDQLSGPLPLADREVNFGNDRRTVYSVPAAALFDHASAKIRDPYDPRLIGLSVRIRTTEGARVEVRGYADTTGPSQYNQRLSKFRAEAVRDVLAANGVRGITARGIGESDAPCRERDGLACNRRVDIVVIKD